MITWCPYAPATARIFRGTKGDNGFLPAERSSGDALGLFVGQNLVLVLQGHGDIVQTV